jgi:hypothetical protein
MAERGVRQAKDEDDWLYAKDIGITGTPGKWIILGGQFQVFPAMAVGETARFYYISNLDHCGRYGDNQGDVHATTRCALPQREAAAPRHRVALAGQQADGIRRGHENFEIAMAEIYGGDKGSKHSHGRARVFQPRLTSPIRGRSRHDID